MASRAVRDPQAIVVQAMVLMMLPSALVGLLEVLEADSPPISAMELSTNDEMIDCTDSALIGEAVPDVVPDELEVLPVRALSRL